MNPRSLGPLLFASTLFACAPNAKAPAKSERKAEITSVFRQADEPLLQQRSALVAGKYARMATSPYAFYRGNLALALHDFQRNGVGASEFLGDTPPVLSLADPHPENFGTIVASDGSLALEPNDLDAAAFAPYVWDLRRLAVGMALAARFANADDEKDQEKSTKAAKDIARAAAEGYARAIEKLEKGGALGRIEKADKDDEDILEDVFKRAKEALNKRSELDELTVFNGEKRVLRRGAINQDEPTEILRDLPAPAYRALAESLEAYRQALAPSLPAEAFTILDAAQKLGMGVGSYPRIRAFVLLRGLTEKDGDEIVLELKEMAASPLSAAFAAPIAYPSDAERVRTATRAAWSRPDADGFWGTTTWMGLACQVRLSSGANKAIRISKMTGKRGKPKALRALGQRLGALVARAHAKSPGNGAEAISAIAHQIKKDPDAFADEQAEMAVRYADQVIADWELFREALAELGPSLGFKSAPAQPPSSDLDPLFRLDP